MAIEPDKGCLTARRLGLLAQSGKLSRERGLRRRRASGRLDRCYSRARCSSARQIKISPAATITMPDRSEIGRIEPGDCELGFSEHLCFGCWGHRGLSSGNRCGCCCRFWRSRGFCCGSRGWFCRRGWFWRRRRFWGGSWFRGRCGSWGGGWFFVWPSRSVPG